MHLSGFAELVEEYDAERGGHREGRALVQRHEQHVVVHLFT